MQHSLPANATNLSEKKMKTHPTMSISEAMPIIDKARELAAIAGPFDEVRDHCTYIEHDLMRYVLEARAKNRADLNAKLAIWQFYVDDPECIFEWHQEAWRLLMTEVALLAGIANQPDLKEAA